MGNPIIKIRRSRDRLIFIIGIPYQKMVMKRGSVSSWNHLYLSWNVLATHSTTLVAYGTIWLLNSFCPWPKISCLSHKPSRERWKFKNRFQVALHRICYIARCPWQSQTGCHSSNNNFILKNMTEILVAPRQFLAAQGIQSNGLLSHPQLCSIS